MRTISKGRFAVVKRLTQKGISLNGGFVARGSKKQCCKYIIKLAEEARAKVWEQEVQISLHVFPKTDNAFFSVITYDENYNEIRRIEYLITIFEDNEKKETKGK